MSRAFMVKQAPFRPTDIGNCALWLDAADSSTLTFSSGSNVSAWRDKIKGYSFVGTGPVLSNFGGQQSLYFNGASYLTNNSFSPSIAPPYTVFAVAYNTTYPQINQRILNGLSGGTYDTNLFAGVFYTYATIFTGNGANWNPLNASAQLGTMYTTWGLISAFITAAIVTPFFNGTPYSTQTGSYTAGTLTGLNIGGGYNSLTTSNDQPWYGYTGEIIFYSRTLSSPERQQVEAYLAQKWGLKATLPQGHPGTRGIVYPQLPLPNASALPYQYTFTPTSIGGCQLWLDGADTTTTILSGANVTTWRDKSGNGYHMNQLTATAVWTGSAEYPTIGTSINGRQTVNFTAQAGLKQSTQLNGVTNLFWLGRIAAPVGSGGGDGYFLLGNDINFDWHGYPYGSTFLHNAVVSTGLKNASPTSLYTSDANAITDTAFSNVYLPSAPNVSLLSVAGITGSQIYQGICYDRANHIGWCGDLAEVLVFSNALTTPQRQQVEGYLAWKWGLQTNLPGSHPYKNAAPTVPNALGISRPAGLPIPPITLYASSRFTGISSGLLARYSMNESSGSIVIDSVAGNNITIGGSPSRVSTSYGTYTGYALSIQNSTQFGYITLPANMVVGAHSMTSWVYFTGFPSQVAGDKKWLGWGATGTGENFAFYNNGTTVKMFGGPSFISGTNFLDNNTDTVGAQLNTWYFCASTWDGSTTWKTYCYSPTTAYAFTYSASMNTVTSSSVFIIGNANSYDQYPAPFGGTGYGGYLGEVRFYNRVLTAGEVASIFAGTG